MRLVKRATVKELVKGGAEKASTPARRALGQPQLARRAVVKPEVVKRVTGQKDGWSDG